MIDWLTSNGLPLVDGRWEWTGSPSLVAFVAVLVGSAWLMAVTVGRSGQPMRLRIAEGVSLAIVAAIVLLTVAGPRQVFEGEREDPGRLVVLLDNSASMAVTVNGVRRADVLEKRLAELGFNNENVDIFSFDEELRMGPPTDFRGRSTDLGAALVALGDRYLGQQVQGIVVLTDGADRGYLRRELRDQVSRGAISAGIRPPLPGPVTIVQVGESSDFVDVSVEDVQSGGFAFLRTPFVLTATVAGHPSTKLSVRLSRDGRQVEERVVLLDENGRGEVPFEVIPREVGRFAWEVSVPTDPSDPIPGNNTFSVVVRVVRERTRVLQVSGSPSYDQKFLRLFLKEDPSVDLVSFFILRTREDFRSGWEASELSLIEFPYERLFSEDLGTFDLVILQNFNYRPYFTLEGDTLLNNIADYVRKGGALVMTGGDRSFDLGDYAGTPLAEVLPVQLGVSGVKTDETPFRPVLTEAGAVHPLTRLGANPEESKLTWERLPNLDGINLTRGLVPGAAALLVHPGLGRAGSPVPVLAVREIGEGRTMALMVDASWRWSFSEAAEGRGNQAYLRFWKNALRWLIADPEDRRIVVTPSKENVILGAEVGIQVHVRDAGYLPVDGAPVTAIVSSPDGTTQELTATTGSSGFANLVYLPTQQGAHRVVAVAGEGKTDQAETVFGVTTRDPELVDIRPDDAFLRQLASLYGDAGRYIGPSESLDLLLDETAVRSVPERRVVEWATAPFLGLLFALFGTAAWWLRRRAGAV